MAESYRVQLDAFEGPLDLLLYLIRRAEVDIHDIPVSRIADGFMDALRAEDLAALDIDLAGEFLVMAATLMELKARVLARDSSPGSERGHEHSGDDDEDPRADLVRQLLEYKKYRDAADDLERRRGDWERMAPALPAGIDGGPLDEALERMREEVELEELDMGVLVQAYQRIAATVNFDRLGEHEVLADETPIEVYADELVGMLREERSSAVEGTVEGTLGTGLTLDALLTGRPRRQMLGMFLAMLDLIKDQRIRVVIDGVGVRIFERDPEEQVSS